jgi:cytoskeletal protein RodZ
MNVKTKQSKFTDDREALKNETEEVNQSLPLQKRLWELLNKPKSDREPTPTEILSELGGRLYQLRQAQLLSLDEVAARTLIAPRVLGAIEAGKLEELPELVYIQGFIRRFADALGLDGAEFASRFPTHAEAQPTKSSWRNSKEAQLRPLHLYLLYVGLVLVSIGSLSHSMNPSGNSQKSSSSASKTLEAKSASSASKSALGAKPQPKMVSTHAAPSQSQKVRVEITVTEASWLSVEADGKVTFEGILSEGTHAWEANEQLTISAGNAGGVLITHNGSQAEKMGEPGVVKEVTFRADAPSQDRT